MTKDRDFKDQVRARAHKTGQSYQATRQALSQAVVPEADAEALVQEVFRVHELLTVGGCTVERGEIRPDDRAILVRDGRILGEGNIRSLRQFKRQMDRVEAGMNCGIQVTGVPELSRGDRIYVRSTGKAQETLNRIIAGVVDAIAEVTGQSPEAISGSGRAAKTALARQQAMYVLDRVGVERAEIARAFGDCPVTQVDRAVHKIAGMVTDGSRAGKQVAALIANTNLLRSQSA